MCNKVIRLCIYDELGLIPDDDDYHLLLQYFNSNFEFLHSEKLKCQGQSRQNPDRMSIKDLLRGCSE